ncbi:MAG: hypothetical protein VKK63_10345 [Synechococcus sp.]|nr:hypothetical protein [Synechococcus sp.]
MTITLPPVPRPAPRRAAPLARRKRTYVSSGPVGKHLAAAAALQLQIQELTAQLNEHRAWLLAHMLDRSVTRLELGDQFQAVLKTRHNWTYSPETEREMHQLRVTQGWEQKQGIATDTPTTYVALTTKPATPVQ